MLRDYTSHQHSSYVSTRLAVATSLDDAITAHESSACSASAHSHYRTHQHCSIASSHAPCSTPLALPLLPDPQLEWIIIYLIAGESY